MSEQIPTKPKFSYKTWEGSSSFVLQGRHWSSALIWLTAALFSSTLIWSFIARIDQTVSVRGRLQPAGSVQDIESPSSGLVSDVFVEEGSVVTVGDPLVLLSAKGLVSLISASTDNLKLLQLEAKALQTIISSQGDPSKFTQLPPIPTLTNQDLYNKLQAARNQTLQFRSQLQQLTIRINSRRKSLSLQEEMVSGLKPLYIDGGIARNTYLQRVNSVQELKAEIASLFGERSRIIGAATSQLNRVNRQLIQSQAQLDSLQEQNSYRTINSPINGTIFNLTVSSNSVVTTSDVLLKIVPSNRLEALIEISNRDIGFVSVGQPVSVAVDSFPAGEFGYLNGTLSELGSDSLPPDSDSPQVYFPATVRLTQQSVLSGDNYLNLQSGMSLTANIKLRSRPAISIITDIFTRQLDGIKRFR